MKRAFDFTAAALGLLVLAIPAALVWLVVKTTSKGPALYWSARVGRDNALFQMPKFRTMTVGTPALATHKLEKAESYLTPPGALLRRLSLDEIPQLWCILKGDMSLVGPRPALFNQDDLIALRTERGVHKLTPGLTGWAQINGRDELSIAEKVSLDAEYLQRRSFLFDLKILLLTIPKVLGMHGVAH